MMEETDIDDCWSLVAVVRECARKVKLRAEASVETNLTTSATTNNNVVGPCPSEPSCSTINLMQLPSTSAAGAATTPVAHGSGSKEELRLCSNPLPPPHPYPHPYAIMNSMTEPTNYLAPQCSKQLSQFGNFPNTSILGSSAVSLNHHFFYKKNKFEDRRVVRCSLEDLPTSDKWAWRKYGQKPIKGSPYPRNYYRCSTTKGCQARKQVERSPIDPNMYIITYTSNHLHPAPPFRNFNGPRISLGSEEMDVRNKDYNILIPKSMAEMDLLTVMEQLHGGENISTSTSTSTSSDNINYNNDETFNKGCDPNTEMEVPVINKWLGDDSIGINASVPPTLAGEYEPPTNMGQNIWDNEVIKHQGFFF
ncbi:WRKY transcription factor 22 [Bienertia sinuspersici]